VGKVQRGPKVPEFLRPRLRIFLSADIIGSTALKQSRFGVSGSSNEPPIDQAAKGPAWFSAIQGFYFEAQQAFIGEWNKAKAEAGDEQLFGSEPILWKTVGDEVLFTKVIDDHRQITTAMHCWIAAIVRMRLFLQDENPSLDVKSVCWTAGFPFRNREIVLDRGRSGVSPKIENYYTESGNLLNKYYKNPSRSGLVIDYVGPSIDTGFRLASFATGRKLIVSVDVAYLISMTQFDGPVRRLDLHYDGSESLKGVIGGSNYPIFWIDMSAESSLARCEDKLITIKSCETINVKEYCDEFYKVYSDFTFRPFIDNDVGQTLAKKPSWYDGHHAALVANFLSPEYEFDSPEPPPNGEAMAVDDSEIGDFGESIFSPDDGR
jgi:hypothetical protein